ncbi:hypothetical protein QBC36DRAFT_228513 [Triangularia setosa]|uniref:Uncharacterized protein n=1 Tax=Triangularia setosa TaxID=2587417 RepID=A0AAN6WFM5_9PEZI|nr:hypothetical protein QBC36DRAFT_228513 [Podospora setosa]
MSPDNNCKAYCEISHGWFWGHPRVMGVQSWHNPCQRGDSCGLTVGLSGPIGETLTVMISDKSNNVTSTKLQKGIGWTNAWTTKHGFNFGLGLRGGLEGGGDLKPFGVPIKATLGADAHMGYTFSDDYTKQKVRSLGVSWDSTITSTQEYGVTRSRSKSVSYASGGSWSKQPWADEYCGSWYAVPLLGMSCGRAAMGELVKNPENGHTTCKIGKTGSFDVCTSYGMKHERIPDDPRTRTVFTLRDCKEKFILPGEWQQQEFAYSISNTQDYYLDHISRWGIRNLEHKPEDDEWVFQRQMDQKLKNFTKTIGAADYNFKYCGRGEYCVQLKLTKNRCYDIPRGYVDPNGGGKSAHVVSATVMPGHCCTLFARHQCLGQPQRLMPGDTNLADVGYLGLAHSVVCDTSEYCKPQKGDRYDSGSQDDYSS